MKLQTTVRLTVCVGAALLAVPSVSAADLFPVTIHVEASATEGKLIPIWRFFGADEPNYAYLENGKKLL